VSIVSGCKEALCYVAIDVEGDRERAFSCSAIKKTYEWLRNRPWGFFCVNRERFECPEALFDPTMANCDEMAALEMWQSVRLLWIGRSDEGCLFYRVPKDVIQLIQKQCVDRRFFRRLRAVANSVGIHDALYSSIYKCDVDFRKEVCGNVVLSGGNSLFPGLADRLEKGLMNLAPSTMKVNVIAAAERKYRAWIGGSILASLPYFCRLWNSKEEYDEMGAAFVNVNCPNESQ
jgi:actin-related protein